MDRARIDNQTDGRIDLPTNACPISLVMQFNCRSFCAVVIALCFGTQGPGLKSSLFHKA